MLKRITKKGFYFIVFLLTSVLTYGQVTVNINSGNPNFPFPQFLSYDFNGTHSLGNLATNNAPGVVHAEMEKIIREAWQIEANRYTYTGDSWGGVNYILSNIGCPYDCSEGVGYALIAAAYMGDKKTFDGIWMREHDLRRVLQPSYRTGVIIRPAYKYGKNTIAEPPAVDPGGGDAATDGDVDIALGLLMAWKQWGEFMGVTGFNGQAISYKKEALDVIEGLVERQNSGYMSGSVVDCRSVSGDVGFDGYLKNGNTGPGETTTFGSGDPLWCPEFGGPNNLHIDYAAPSYFYSFRQEMTTAGFDPWEINQMYRAEASSDWIMGKLLANPRGLPHAGWANVNGSNVTFSSFNLGEDFRAAWRTILNYVWHGDPTYTWDPATHTVQSGVPNSFEQLVGKRFANFLTDQRKAPWSNTCVDLGGGPALTYTGPPITSVQYDPNTGAVLYPLPINWGMATSAPSTIAAQDYDLMGDMFRQCAIEWDITAAGDRYITSKPVYFHGFFRLLGMLILSGNFQDPLVAKPIANIKVYRAVDKTYGYTGDQFQFTLSYRNYGTVAAANTQIVETLPADFDYVPGSASNGGVYNAGARSITWNIGSVPGFSTAGGITPTQGLRTYNLKAGTNADGRYCAAATITASNSKSWTTNEYPNNVTEVMERNCIDIVKRALLIDKSVNYARVENNTEVKFKIDFENSSTAGWLNGGRPNVFFSYSQGTYGANGDTRGIKIRLFHGAAEPYINYKNYRISAFLNDNTYSCISGVGPCAIGWGLRNTIYEGGAATGVTFSQEAITPGTDARGKWNQRVIIQFADQIATTTPQLSAQYGKPDRIHQGGTEPLRAVWDLYTSNYGAIDWSDDWSWDAAAADVDGGLYFPVTNDWTDPYNLNIPVTKWHKNACETATKTVDNVLIEEWDGYTWRRVYGNGPLPGRDVANVIVRDTLPLGLTFNGWVQQTTLGISATYDPTTRVITWTIPKLQVGQKGSLEYKAIATFTTAGSCPKADQKLINSGWIQGDNESKKADTASVTVTCDAVILPPTPTTMTKTANKAAYVVGDAITYTIAYTQTHGAIIDASMSTAADWNQYGGTWNFGTAISNSTTNSTGTMLIHKKAHGTNGTITGSLQIAANASFSIALRQTGTTIASGSYISFKPNPGAGTIAVSVWNGTTQVGATQTIGYPGAPQNFKIVLNGNQLNLWMGTLTGSPTLTVTGLTVQAGYIGFLNGTPTGSDTYANHSVLSLHSEMDSAYDIIISDPIPTGITFSTASNSGVNTAGTIAWPSVAGPVLYGTVITRTWTGTVATCAATGKIVNNAYANMLGQATNSIAAQSIVTCGGGSSCVPPTTVTATVANTAICFGSALSITGSASPANSNYYYTWFKDGAAVTTATKTYAPYAKTATVAADAGTYKLRVEDGNAGTASCYKESSDIIITINALPIAGAISADQTICSGSVPNALTGTVSTGGVTVKNYKWQSSTTNGTTGPWTEVAAYSTTATGFIPGTISADTWFRRIDSSGVCAGVATNSIKITVTPGITTGTISTDQTICAGSIPNALTGTVSTGGVTVKNYKWQRSTTNGTTGPWTQVAAYSTTATGFTLGAISVDTWFRRIDSSGVCAGVATNSIKITTTPAVTAGTISADQTICAGAVPNALTGTVSTGGVTVKNYKWQSSTTNGTTGPWTQVAAYSTTGTGFALGAISVDTWFRRIDSSGVCAGVATGSIKITATSSVTAGAVVADQTICYNIAPAAFTSTTAATGGTGTFAYQWQSSTTTGSGFGDIATATNATYTDATLLTADKYYRRKVTSGASSACNVAYTVEIHVTVSPNFVVGSIGNPQTVCQTGNPAALTSVSLPIGGQIAYTYQWQSSASTGTGFTDISGATNTTYDPPAGIAATTYFRRVDKSAGGCGSLNTNEVIVTVTPNVTPSVTIATPATTICTGTSVTFTATATNGGTSPGYQWYKGAAPTGIAIATATNATYTTLTAADNDSYYVVMTSNATCASTPTATSNAVVITVTTAVTPAVSITALPAGSICAGSSVTFTAVAGNGGLAPTYEWFIGVTSQGAASITATTFTSATLVDGDQISVVMTSNSSCVAAPGTATSNIITIAVNPNVPPSIGITVSPMTAICSGESLTFTQTSVNGGIPTYQWKKDGIDITGATNASYTTTEAANFDSYTVTMTSTETCVSPRIVTSNAIMTTVNPILVPSVTLAANPTTICTNGSTMFTATPTNGGLPMYEWFIGTISYGTVSTDPNFITTALTSSTDVVKVVMTSNEMCASTVPVSASMSITVNSGITAGSIGGSQTICYGGTPITITEVTASDATSVSYVWEEANLTTPTIWTTANGTVSNGGKDFTPPSLTAGMYYHRIVTDASASAPCNVATSNTIHIIVNPQLVAGVIGSDETMCSGAVPLVMTQTTAPTGGTGTYTYQWQSDASGSFQNIAGATNTSYTSGALTATTQFQLIATSGTCGSITSNIVTKTITTPETVTVSINDPGQVCAGSAAFTFTAAASTTGTGTLSYAWDINGPVGTNSSTYTYNPVIGDAGKVVKVVVTTSNGCNTGPATSNLVTLDIVGATTPTVAITANNNPNCAGLQTTFTATSTGGGGSPTYQWYVIPFGSTIPTAVGTGGTSYTTATLGDKDQVYVELTSSLTCLTAGISNPFPSNKITMTIKPIPAPTITEGDQTVCSPNGFTFHGVATSGNTLEWRSLPNNTVVGTTADLTTNQGGTYTLYEDNGTCNSTSAPVVLNVVQTPIANAGSDIYLKDGEAGNLNGSGGAVYSWSPATYLSSTIVSNPNFTATQTITYTLTVADATSTCSSTDEVTVYVVSPVEVPNVITVNGDGTNDDWEIKNIEGYPNVIIEIYNRWGNLVWKTEGYPKNWDGTNFRNGQVLPDGTYFYIINLQSQIYDEPLTGWVQIIR